MTESFKPDDQIDTPYAKARQEWDKRIGTSISQAANWRLIAFGLTIIVFFMTGGLIYLGKQPKVVPYVVEVTPYGDIWTKGLEKEYSYVPSESLEKYFVVNFVRSLRAISADYVVNRERFENAYNFLSQRSYKVLKDMHRRNNPLDEAKDKTRTVMVETILPVSANTFQVDWTEVEYDTSGSRTGIKEYRGVFTTLRAKPASSEAAMKNPLGLYIDHFTWQEK